MKLPSWTEPILGLARLGRRTLPPMPEPRAGDDPMKLLAAWMEAGRTLPLAMADAMALATCTTSGRPSVRMVLPKEVDERGVVFYTHRTSRKGRELAENPWAAGCFYWDALARQARVEGEVVAMPDEAADAYFATRPRKSQLGAWISRQSQPMTDRDAIPRELDAMEERFSGQPVPRPEGWVGYRLVARRVELWQGRAFRMHDRFAFEREASGWSFARLWPLRDRRLAGATLAAMQPRPRVSAEEYLTRERAAETRSELVHGEIVAMAGASPRHNALVRNVLVSLTGRLRGKPCQPYPSDLRVHVPATGLFTYPDVTVVCAPLQRHPSDDATVQNPRVIFEVLSKGTEAYDRGAKFGHYRSIPSLQIYVMVIPDEPRVEVYARAERKWELDELVGGEALLELAAIDVRFPVGELYLDLPDE